MEDAAIGTLQELGAGPRKVPVRPELRRIAHDLNDMLTTIMGNADLILDDAGSSEAVREDVNEILRAAERVRKITLALVSPPGTGSARRK